MSRKEYIEKRLSEIDKEQTKLMDELREIGRKEMGIPDFKSKFIHIPKPDLYMYVKDQITDRPDLDIWLGGPAFRCNSSGNQYPELSYFEYAGLKHVRLIDKELGTIEEITREEFLDKLKGFDIVKEVEKYI